MQLSSRYAGEWSDTEQRGFGRWWRSEAAAGVRFVAPATALLVGLTIFPVVYIVWVSLHKYNLLQSRSMEWVGLANYPWLLTRPLWWQSLLTQAGFVVGALALELLVGLGLALLLFRELPGIGLVRTILTTPILISPVVVGLMWRYMYEPDYGVINFLFQAVGLPAQGWLSDPNQALLALVLVDAWQWSPFIFLVFLAGLHAIPQRIIEAAQLDGARFHHLLWYHYLPLLRRVIDTIRGVDLILVTTRGGPGTATYTAPIYNWVLMFSSNEMGDASAVSLVLLIIISIFVTLFLRALTPPHAR